MGAGSLQEHWASPLFPSALAASTHGGTLWPPPPPQSSTLVLVATLSSAPGLPEDPRQALLTVPPLWSVPSPSSHLPPDCPRSVPSQPPAPVPLAPPPCSWSLCCHRGVTRSFNRGRRRQGQATVARGRSPLLPRWRFWNLFPFVFPSRRGFWRTHVLSLSHFGAAGWAGAKAAVPGGLVWVCADRGPSAAPSACPLPFKLHAPLALCP